MSVQSMHLYCQQSQRPYQCRQSRKMAFKAAHLNRIGSWGVCLAHCDIWWPLCVVVSRLPFWWFICAQNSTSIPKQRSVTTGLGWKCFPSQISSSACQNDCLHCNMWGLRISYVRDWERVFVDFRHGGRVFVLVGVLNIKYFVVFAMFKKKLHGVQYSVFHLFLFWPTRNGRQWAFKELGSFVPLWNAAHSDISFSFLS